MSFAPVVAAAGLSLPELSASSTWTTMLEPIATRARALCHRNKVVADRLTLDPLTTDHYKFQSHSCAFEAFLALGGDVDHPHIFPWTERHEELVMKAAHLLRDEVSGRKTAFGDAERRLATRRNRAMLDDKQWTAWKYGAASGAASGHSFHTGSAKCGYSAILRNRARQVDEYTDGAEQEEAARSAELGQFVEQLRLVLSEREFKWLYEREVQHKSQYEQAEEFCAANPSYQDETGTARALNLINVAVHRARKKAAQKLAPKWRTRAVEACA